MILLQNPAPSENILTYVLWVMAGLLIVCISALIWVIKNKPTAPTNSNGLQARMDNVEDEIVRLRDWRHTADPQIKMLMADHLARLKASRR